jgi:flavin reductase (DIM6/NTAB) family NADH-FMN oxidoreductase RutF
MELDPTTLRGPDRYRLLIACLLPRPIAWVSTLSPQGTANLAPFSFFAGVTSHPPTVMLSVARRRDQPKDTSRNLIATGECVIHIPPRALAEAMVATSAEVGPEVDEFALVGLEQALSFAVRPPRVAAAPIAMECRLSQHLQVGTLPTDVFLLEIVHLYVSDEVLDSGLPDPVRLAAVGRLGGEQYCDTHEVFTIARPKTP